MLLLAAIVKQAVSESSIDPKQILIIIAERIKIKVSAIALDLALGQIRGLVVEIGEKLLESGTILPLQRVQRQRF